MATLLPELSSDEDEPKNVDQQEDSDEEMDQDFEFGGVLGEDGGLFKPSNGWSYQSALDLLEQNDNTSSALPRMDVASLIAAKRKVLKKQKEQIDDEASGDEDQPDEEDMYQSDSVDDGDEEGDSDSSDDDEDDEIDEPASGLEDDVLKTRTGKDEEGLGQKDDEDDVNEAHKAAVYFDNHETVSDEIEVFAQLTLSRPLLRGVAAMGFTKPTPVQSVVIPVALAGRDVCASAQTGSGKTAAFLLPIMERIHQRTSGGSIKGLILTPTRELAAQCLGMMNTLAQFTKMRASLIVGGAKNIQAQAAELRTRPDVVVGTPGRLLDHITNSPGVSLDDIEFLVLDECDRLLQLGFQEEVHELVKACPIQRQTLLFSATLNTKVDELIKLSLKRPVRIKISNKRNADSAEVEVAEKLEQEFVRVRAGNEGTNREGMLLAMLTRTFTERTIVFFDTKAAAHRLMIICGLCGIKCSELHGNLTQLQRLNALEEFRKGDVDVLLATDLAARGLDIDRVQCVINFEMPSQVETYVHRIGRSARRGRAGKSCTLIGEGRRHLMKEVIKDAEEKTKSTDNGQNTSSSKSGIIRSRTIPAGVVGHFVEKIKSLELHVEEVLQAEAVAKLDRITEMEAIKAQNIIEHSDEIKSRPKREWFASNKDKKLTKEAAAEKARLIKEKIGTGSHRMTRKKRRAREAQDMLREFQQEAKATAEETGQKTKKLAITDQNIKSTARSQKKASQQQALAARDTSIHDEDQEQKRSKQKEQQKKKRKGAFASDALGDSSLFDEEKVTHSKKKYKGEEEAAARPSSYKFKGFDPLLDGKKIKKKGNQKFKSKSKYKRRG